MKRLSLGKYQLFHVLMGHDNLKANKYLFTLRQFVASLFLRNSTPQDNNTLSGSIPAEIGNVLGMVELNLGKCQLIAASFVLVYNRDISIVSNNH